MFTELLANLTDFEQGFLGGVTGASLLALGAFALAVLLIFVVALYVYSSYSWMTIARKLKYKRSWFAWIPVLNIVLLLQLAGFAWGWVFLILIPILGWLAIYALIIISTWRIFEKRGYNGLWSLLLLGIALSDAISGVCFVAYLIVLGYVAYKEKRKVAVVSKKKVVKKSSKKRR
jgi:hypothetical protein